MPDDRLGVHVPVADAGVEAVNVGVVQVLGDLEEAGHLEGAALGAFEALQLPREVLLAVDDAFQVILELAAGTKKNMFTHKVR